MNIGEVFTRAWDVIWKNKVLWIFGLFASLAGGSGGNNFRYTFEQNGASGSMPANIPAWVFVLLILLAIAVIVVLVILSTLGRAGLVRGAWLADSGETGLRFGSLFRESQAYFWRVILLALLVVGISLSLILALVIPTVLTAGIAALCLWPLFCLLVPFFIVLTVIVELAIIAIVGEDLGVMDSLRRAWEVFRANLPMMIAVGLTIAIASAVIGFLASLPLFATLAPMIVFANTGGNSSFGALLVGIILFLLYLPILLLVQSVVTAYIETTWTITFRRLTGRPAGSVALPPQTAL
ncbi:MAG: hypothetical protein EHM21_17595 [Chloroflexi bacterium]|nr:MAG: hypothetical protein EHM21_17595 [Chloroflexota bacterium]